MCRETVVKYPDIKSYENSFGLCRVFFPCGRTKRHYEPNRRVLEPGNAFLYRTMLKPFRVASLFERVAAETTTYQIHILYAIKSHFYISIIWRYRRCSGIWVTSAFRCLVCCCVFCFRNGFKAIRNAASMLRKTDLRMSYVTKPLSVDKFGRPSAPLYNDITSQLDGLFTGNSHVLMTT
jgi:hypothetical protein